MEQAHIINKGNSIAPGNQQKHPLPNPTQNNRHGKYTHDFSQKVNRKMYRAAMRSILSELNRQERLIVVDELAMDQPKTGSLVEMLGKLDASQALVIVAEDSPNVELSARNVQSVSVCTSRDIDPVSLVRHDKIVLTAQAARNIDEALQ